jgi:hypothetical protein
MTGTYRGDPTLRPREIMALEQSKGNPCSYKQAWRTLGAARAEAVGGEAEWVDPCRRTISELAMGFGFRFNDKIVDTLMPGGEHLKVSNEFISLARQGQWIIYCFQEEYGVQGLLGRKVSIP